MKDELKKQEMTNRILNSEVQCLKLQLQETDKDHQSLVQLASTDSIEFQLNDFVHHGESNLAVPDVHEEQEEVGLVEEMTKSLEALDLDFQEAKLVRDKMKAESDLAKHYAEELNQFILETLKSKDEYHDLDRIVMESCKLQREYESSQKSKNTKHRSKRVHRKQMGYVTQGQVGKILGLMQKEQKLANKCQKYLQNTSLMLAESIVVKDKDVLIHQEANQTLSAKLQHLLSHITEDLPSQELKSVAKEQPFVPGGVEVEFEQPSVMSLTNYNFKLHDSLTEDDEEETKQQSEAC